MWPKTGRGFVALKRALKFMYGHRRPVCCSMVTRTWRLRSCAQDTTNRLARLWLGIHVGCKEPRHVQCGSPPTHALDCAASSAPSPSTSLYPTLFHIKIIIVIIIITIQHRPSTPLDPCMLPLVSLHPTSLTQLYPLFSSPLQLQLLNSLIIYKSVHWLKKLPQLCF